MNDLIEKLKKNEKPFGLLSPEEQECIEKAGERNCLCYTQRWDPAHFTKPYRGNTYAIKPDYQPEPYCLIPRGMDDWSFKFCEGPSIPKECKDCPEHISNKPEPEPEFEDVEIERNGDWLGVWKGKCPSLQLANAMPSNFTHILHLSSMEKFDDFWYQDSPGCKVSGLKETVIARCRFEGKKVFASFRK